MNDDSLSDLETHLQRDAERMLNWGNYVPPTTGLMQRHENHLRRKRRRRNVGVTLLAGAIIAAWATLGRIQPVPESGEIAGEREKSAPREPLVQSSRAVPDASESSERDEVIGVPPEAGYVPVVLVRRNAQGKPLFVPALYVPESSELIDFSRLSQPQQRAVRAVLGLEQKPKTRKPI